MSSPDDCRNWELFLKELCHLLRLGQGTADRQVDQAETACAVAKRQAARFRLAEQFACAYFRVPLPGGQPMVPVRPKEIVDGQGVWNLRIGECPDSSVWFAFDDDEEWFTLGSRLASLLMFLVPRQAPGRNGDEFVAFRTRREILDHLREIGGRDYNPEHVNKMVNKLRDSLRALGKRFLIATHRDKGVRFLVRRGGVQYMQLDSIPARRRVACARVPTHSE